MERYEGYKRKGEWAKSAINNIEIQEPLFTFSPEHFGVFNIRSLLHPATVYAKHSHYHASFLILYAFMFETLHVISFLRIIQGL